MTVWVKPAMPHRQKINVEDFPRVVFAGGMRLTHITGFVTCNGPYIIKISNENHCLRRKIGL